MHTEIEGEARKTSPSQLLASASLGKSSALCYCLINKVKIEFNTTVIKNYFK